MIINQVKSASLRLKNAIPILWWFVSKVGFHVKYRKLSIHIVVCQFLGNAILAASVVSVLFLIQNYDQEIIIPVINSTLTITSYFFEYFAVSFGFILLGSFLIFWSRKRIIDCSLLFETEFLRELTCSFGALPGSFLTKEHAFSKSNHAFNVIASKSTSEVARSLRILLQITNSLVMLFYSLAIMAILNPVVNIIFLSLVAIFAPLYYWASARAVRGAHGVASYRSKANLLWRERKKAFECESLLSNKNLKDVDGIFTSSLFINAHQAMRARLTAPIYAQFFANVGLAFALLATIVYLIGMSVAEQYSFEKTIATIMLMQVILISFRGAIQSLTSIMRLYPSIQNCYQALTTNANGKKEPNKLLSKIKITLLNDEAVNLKSGDVIYLKSDIKLQRYNLGFAVFMLAERSKCDYETVILHTQFLFGDEKGCFQSNGSIHLNRLWSGLNVLFPGKEITKEVKGVLDCENVNFDDALDLRQLSQADAILLTLLVGLTRKQNFVFIDLHCYETLDAHHTTLLRQISAKAIIVVCVSVLEKNALLSEQSYTTLFINDDGVQFFKYHATAELTAENFGVGQMNLDDELLEDDLDN